MEMAEMPRNRDAERAVLGAMMAGDAPLSEVLGRLSEKDFFFVEHRAVFEAARLLDERGAGVDILTVAEEMKRLGTLEGSGGRSYVAELRRECASPGMVGSYIEPVLDCSRRRGLVGIARRMMESAAKGRETADAVAGRAEGELSAMQDGGRQGFELLSDVAGSVLSESMELFDARRDGEDTEREGLSTGFPSLDRITGGLHRGAMVVLAARPSVGKSALGLNIAVGASLSTSPGPVVAVFSMEMSARAIARRALASCSGVPARAIRTGDLGEEGIRALNLGLDRLLRTRIYVSDRSSVTPYAIRSQCRRLRQSVGLDLVVVDYIGLMESGGEGGRARQENRQNEVARYSRFLKRMAVEMDVPVLALSQLNRNSEYRMDRRPTIADLRDSGAIEQDADVVMLLHRELSLQEASKLQWEGEPQEGYVSNEGSVGVVNVAKNRERETGVVRLRWDGPRTQFTEEPDPPAPPPRERDAETGVELPF